MPVLEAQMVENPRRKKAVRRNAPKKRAARRRTHHAAPKRHARRTSKAAPKVTVVRVNSNPKRHHAKRRAYRRNPASGMKEAAKGMGLGFLAGLAGAGLDYGASRLPVSPNMQHLAFGGVTLAATVGLHYAHPALGIGMASALAYGGTNRLRFYLAMRKAQQANQPAAGAQPAKTGTRGLGARVPASSQAFHTMRAGGL